MEKRIKVQDFCSIYEASNYNDILSEIADKWAKDYDNNILDLFTSKIQINLDMNINKETCRKWIEQQIKMDNFTEEEITDICIRELIDNLYKQINELKEQIKAKDEIIKNIKDIIGD